jgi:hypothetical protein
MADSSEGDGGELRRAGEEVRGRQEDVDEMETHGSAAEARERQIPSPSPSRPPTASPSRPRTASLWGGRSAPSSRGSSPSSPRVRM